MAACAHFSMGDGHGPCGRDSTADHTALSAQSFLIQNGLTAVPHPPYSPHLTPNEKKPQKETFCSVCCCGGAEIRTAAAPDSVETERAHCSEHPDGRTPSEHFEGD